MSTMMITHTGYSTSKLAVLAGRVMKMGIPVQATVKIMSKNACVVIKTLKTDRNGRYKAYVPYSSTYLIFAQDLNKVFNAVIQDNVVSK